MQHEELTFHYCEQWGLAQSRPSLKEIGQVSLRSALCFCGAYLKVLSNFFDSIWPITNTLPSNQHHEFHEASFLKLKVMLVSFKFCKGIPEANNNWLRESFTKI